MGWSNGVIVGQTDRPTNSLIDSKMGWSNEEKVGQTDRQTCWAEHLRHV